MCCFELPGGDEIGFFTSFNLDFFRGGWGLGGGGVSTMIQDSFTSSTTVSSNSFLSRSPSSSSSFDFTLRVCSRSVVSDLDLLSEATSSPLGVLPGSLQRDTTWGLAGGEGRGFKTGNFDSERPEPFSAVFCAKWVDDL